MYIIKTDHQEHITNMTSSKTTRSMEPWESFLASFFFFLEDITNMTSSKTTRSMEPWESFLASFFFFLEGGGKQNICRKFIVLKQFNILMSSGLMMKVKAITCKVYGCHCGGVVSHWYYNNYYYFSKWILFKNIIKNIFNIYKNNLKTL
jgi:hypothetical protein